MGQYAKDIAWTHRTSSDSAIYFVSNQLDSARSIQLSLRVTGKIPWLYDPVTGRKWQAKEWQFKNGRTLVAVKLPRNGSLFVILVDHTNKSSHEMNEEEDERQEKVLRGEWKVRFDTAYGGPKGEVTFKNLQDWTSNSNDSIRYYSGTADYRTTFSWRQKTSRDVPVWLDLGKVDNIARVIVNGKDCGVAWTYPYRVDISKALKAGENRLDIRVTNTWRNRLIQDHSLPEKERVTRTNASFRNKLMKLVPAGLFGPVRIVEITSNQ
jgi:hypothetical protein